MSAITTWGWGAQGGLITIGGWGGAPSGVPAMPVRYRPRLARAFELVPQIQSENKDPAPVLKIKQLRPQILDPIPPKQGAQPQAKELIPQIDVAEKLIAPKIEAKSLIPQLTIESQEEKIPKIKAAEIKPRIMGAQPVKQPMQPETKLIKPEIKDGQGD